MSESRSDEVKQSVNRTEDIKSMEQELHDIAQMSQESLADSIGPMEAVLREQYGTEILEESLLLKDEIRISLINLRISLWPNLKNYSKNFLEDKLNKLQQSLIFTPISKDFNFTSCTVSQFWAVVILAAKCCGEIFANMWIGHNLLSIFLRKSIPSLLFIYIIMPIFAYLLNKKLPMSKVSLTERRWLVLIFSFWVGASTHYSLINWDPGVFSPPPLYSPTLVALLFEFVGPSLADNRPLLLLSTIGVASCVCFMYAFLKACFTFTYFCTSVIAIASSFYNMQLHLADSNLGRGDVIEGNVLLPIHSMYMQLAMTLIYGRYIWNRDPMVVVPDSMEERYTLLLRRLH